MSEEASEEAAEEDPDPGGTGEIGRWVGILFFESLDPPSTFSAASFLLVVGSWRWLVGGDGGPARLGTLGGESSADWLPGPERRRPSLSVAAPLSDATTACTLLAIRMAEEVSEEESEEAEEEEEEDREEES